MTFQSHRRNIKPIIIKVSPDKFSVGVDVHFCRIYFIDISTHKYILAFLGLSEPISPGNAAKSNQFNKSTSHHKVCRIASFRIFTYGEQLLVRAALSLMPMSNGPTTGLNYAHRRRREDFASVTRSTGTRNLNLRLIHL